MLSALLNILSKIVSVLFFFWKRKESPSNQYEQAKQANEKAVLNSDIDAVNARVNANLDRLSDSSPGGGNPL